MKTEKVSNNLNSTPINTETTVNTTKTASTQEVTPFIDFLNSQLSFNSKFAAEKNLDSTKNDDLKDTIIIKKNEEQLVTVDLTVTKNETDQNSEKSTSTKSDNKFADDFLKLDARKLTFEDLKQIHSIANNNGIAININQINGFNNFNINYNVSEYSQNAMNFSKNLADMLEKASKSNKPIRIDIDKNSSVILKINKDGKISAHFISSDKAMEMLLKDNLHQLRAKFEEEGLPYKELDYQQNKRDNQQKESNKE